MLKINEVRPTDTFSFRHSLPQEAHKAILEEKICQKNRSTSTEIPTKVLETVPQKMCPPNGLH